MTTGSFSLNKGFFNEESSDFLCCPARVCVCGGCQNGPMDVTTASQGDVLNLGISETITTNVASMSGGIGWVNENDVRVTSVGGTYNNGAGTIDPNSGIAAVAGTWSFPGGGAIISESRGSPPRWPSRRTELDRATASSGHRRCRNPGYSEIKFDTTGSSPGLACTGEDINGSFWDAAHANRWILHQLHQLQRPADRTTPGGTWTAPAPFRPATVSITRCWRRFMCFQARSTPRSIPRMATPGT